MHYIQHLIEGVLTGMGMIFGVILALIMLLVLLKKLLKAKERQYDASELKKAFELFLIKLSEEEQYEHLEAAKAVRESLEKGIVPCLAAYVIKSELKLVMDAEQDETSSITLGKKYHVSLK